MKTVHFYKLSRVNLWVQLVLISTQLPSQVEIEYSYGATIVTFPKKLSKLVGKAIGKAVKGRDFRKVENP